MIGPAWASNPDSPITMQAACTVMLPTEGGGYQSEELIYFLVVLQSRIWNPDHFSTSLTIAEFRGFYEIY